MATCRRSLDTPAGELRLVCHVPLAEGEMTGKQKDAWHRFQRVSDQLVLDFAHAVPTTPEESAHG